MHAELCDGCSAVGSRLEEVGYLGRVYCAKCLDQARAYTAAVKKLREEMAETFTLRLEGIRAALTPPLLKRPDQP